jgi:hypothetical protein
MTYDHAKQIVLANLQAAHCPRCQRNVLLLPGVEVVSRCGAGCGGYIWGGGGVWNHMGYIMKGHTKFYWVQEGPDPDPSAKIVTFARAYGMGASRIASTL